MERKGFRKGKKKIILRSNKTGSLYPEPMPDRGLRIPKSFFDEICIKAMECREYLKHMINPDSVRNFAANMVQKVQNTVQRSW